MKRWRSFGASVIGPGHSISGQPNQDAWLSFHRNWGDGIVVSDGLGSKPFSDFGSHAACFAVASAFHDFRKNPGMGSAYLSDLIKEKWLYRVSPLKPHDCAATCMFAFCMDDGVVRMGMIGDGLMAVVKTDDSVVSLSDDKAQGFSNVTDALSPHMTEKDWRWLSFHEDDCKSIILFTDGVADDLQDINGFVKEFIHAHCGLSSVTASRRAREVLENWPTPMHSDDKTIACMNRMEVADE